MADKVGTVRRLRLAAELRRLRTLAGLTADDVATALGWSGSKVSRIELHRTGVKPGDLDQLLDVYQVSEPHRRQLQALAQGPEGRGWWEAYAGTIGEEFATLIALEAEAVAELYWSAELVAGLLQTYGYAKAVLNAHFGLTARVPPGELERHLEVRMRRQELLSRDEPLRLSAVLDESVLLRRFGTPEVMREQLRHLIEMSAMPNVTLRVLPLDGRHPISTGAFTLLEFGADHGRALNDIVFLELLSRSGMYEDESEAYDHRLAFDELADAALDPDESVALIGRTVRDRWS